MQAPRFNNKTPELSEGLEIFIHGILTNSCCFKSVS